MNPYLLMILRNDLLHSPLTTIITLPRLVLLERDDDVGAKRQCGEISFFKHYKDLIGHLHVINGK